MNELSFDSLPKAVQELNSKLDNLILMQSTSKEDSIQKDLLNIEEAAIFLNLTKNTLYSKVRKRTIPFMKQGNRLYFSRKELIDYVKSGRVSTGKEIKDQADIFLSNKNKNF